MDNYAGGVTSIVPVWKNMKLDLYLIGLKRYTLVSSSSSTSNNFAARPLEENFLTNEKENYRKVMNTALIIAVEDREIFETLM